MSGKRQKNQNQQAFWFAGATIGSCQIFTVPSSDEDKSCWPLGCSDNEVTVPVWAASTIFSFPVAASQKRIVLSALPDASV